MFTIIGLGNPGTEYENTRHNTGRIILQKIAKDLDFSDWKSDTKSKSLVSTGKIGKKKAMLMMPETFMNKSGFSVAYFFKSKKATEDMVVIYDDLDLPIGRIKISYNRSAGGHRGLLSIIKAVKTEAFVRIRVGISPVTPSGKTKKPVGDKKVGDYILGKFKDSEILILKKLSKKIGDALVCIADESREKAMTLYNG